MVSFEQFEQYVQYYCDHHADYDHRCDREVEQKIIPFNSYVTW